MVWREAAAVVIIDDANLGKPRSHELSDARKRPINRGFSWWAL
jgi:hypothetical protein